MRILLATDAWHPQINGVVRTLSTTVDDLRDKGHEVEVVAPDVATTLPLPGYPEIRLALAPGRRIGAIMDRFRPDAVHIPVEGPVGWAARRQCAKRGWPFTTSFHTRIGTYIRKKYGLPEGGAFAYQRWFHNAGGGLMVQTPSLMTELAGRGFRNLRYWSRGVDAAFFRPVARDTLGLKRPIFGYVGRVSTEKNVEVFLEMDLPGTKLVIGDGPQRAQLMARHPDVVWAGYRQGEELIRYYGELDVFVFPSRFETFGLVVLEALACGVPVAAFPVQGPMDILTGTSVGRLDEDLRAAALACLGISRAECRDFALNFSWGKSTNEFIGNLIPIRQVMAA